MSSVELTQVEHVTVPHSYISLQALHINIRFDYRYLTVKWGLPKWSTLQCITLSLVSELYTQILDLDENTWGSKFNKIDPNMVNAHYNEWWPSEAPSFALNQFCNKR